MYLHTLPNELSLHDVVYWIDGPSVDLEFRDRIKKTLYSSSGSSWVSGVKIAGGRSYVSGGVDEYVSIPSGLSVASMLIWFNPSSGDGALVDFEDSTVYISMSSNEIVLNGINNGTSYINGSQSETFTPSSWNLLAVNCDAITTTSSSFLGYNGDTTSFFAGSFGPVIFLKKALTVEQIGQYYNATKPFSFTPDLISDMSFWFDSKDLSTLSLSGSDITEWRDKTTNLNHLNSITGTPELVAGGVSVATTETLARTSGFTNVLSGSGQHTLFVVADLPLMSGSLVDFPGIFSVLSNSAGNLARRPLIFGWRALELVVNSPSTGETAVVDSSTGAKIFISEFDGVGNNAFTDGVDSGTGTLTLDVSTTPTVIRLKDTQASGQTFIFKEIIYYRKLLSTSQKNDVTAYLEIKWGI